MAYTYLEPPHAKRYKPHRRPAGDVSRTPRWRAGTRRNKQLRTVPTFGSDRKAATR